MSEPQPSAGRADRRGFWSFWATLPGVLTGVAAVLTAIVGIVTVWPSSNDEQRPEPTGERPAASVTVRSSDAEDLPEGVLAQGRLTMKDADFADFERGVVGQPDNDDMYLHATEELITSYGSAPTPGPADEQECVTALNARHDTQVWLDEMDPGVWLCLRTQEGHVAAVEIVEDASAGHPQIVFSYTVWY